MEEDKVAPAAELAPSDEDINLLLDELIDLESFNLIGLLQDVQDRFGFLPPAALEGISKRTRISLSERRRSIIMERTLFSATRSGSQAI